MLKKHQRLSAGMIPQVLKQGKTMRFSYFNVKYQADSDSAAISVIISKKVLRGAVGRNRVRRCLYSALSPLPTWYTGRMAVLVQKLPEQITTASFAPDAEELFKTLKTHV